MRKPKLNMVKVKRYLPAVLTGISVLGVGVTAYTSYKAGREKFCIDNFGDDQDDDQKKKDTVKAFIPMAISSSVTIAAIIFNQRMNARQKAELTASVMCLTKVINDYQMEIHDRLEDKQANEIDKAVYDRNPQFLDKVEEVTNITFTDYGCLTCDSVDLGCGGDQLFYDPYADRWFRSSLLAVTAAEYHLNRNFNLRGYCTLEEFYGFLGLGMPDEFESIGWESMKVCDEQGSYWLDFGHNYVTDRGNEEPFYELFYVFEPYDLSEVMDRC